jgi:hypothetical protein
LSAKASCAYGRAGSSKVIGPPHIFDVSLIRNKAQNSLTSTRAD